MAFDVDIIHRIADEIESSAKKLKEQVNSPNELTKQLQVIQSSVNSLQSLTRNGAAGGNASTAQQTPGQNQM